MAQTTEISREFYQALRSAGIRLMNGMGRLSGEALKAIAEQANEELWALPMWGNVFRVDDSCDERKIRALLCDGFSCEDEGEADDLVSRYGLTVCKDDFIDDDEDLDEQSFCDAVREALDDAHCEDFYLSQSGWEDVASTGFVAIDIDGDLYLGVNGAGYDFIDAHWVKLYQALGYSWHLFELKERAAEEALGRVRCEIRRSGEIGQDIMENEHLKPALLRYMEVIEREPQTFDEEAPAE